MENLQTNLNLLAAVETYLQDWLWGLAYQKVHRKGEAGIPDIGEHPQ
jgi:hypothetical protein